MRVIGKQVSDAGGRPIVIENKTGAGGAIGVMAVKEAAPDGYTARRGLAAARTCSTRTPPPTSPTTR